LIDLEDGEANVNAELDGPGFGVKSVQDFGLGGVLNFTVTAVNTEDTAGGSLFVHLGEDDLGLESGVFGQGSGDNLEGSAELLDSVLVEAGLGLGELLNLRSNVELGGTSSSDHAAVSDEGLDSGNSVVDGSLGVVETGDGGATEDDSGHFVLVFVSAEDSAPSAGDFLESNIVGVTHLFGRGGGQLDDRGGTDSACNSLEFPLAHDLDGHDSVFLKEVDGELGHGATSNDNLDTSLSKSLDEAFESIFLTLGVPEKVLGVLEQDGSLGLSLLHLNVSVENGNLGLLDGADSGLGAADDNDTVDNLGIVDTSTEDFLNTDVVNVKVGNSLGHGVDGSLGDFLAEEVLKTELLGGNSRFDA